MKTFQEFITEVEAYSNIRSLAPYRIMPPLKTKDGKPNPAPQRFLINPRTGLGPTAQIAPIPFSSPIKGILGVDTRSEKQRARDRGLTVKGQADFYDTEWGKMQGGPPKGP